MGNDNPKPQGPPPPSIEDCILEMRMSAKKFEMESRRAENDKKK